MEDGLESHVNDIQLPENVKNGEIDSSMANFPEGTVTEAKDDKKSSGSPKVNGDYSQEYEETNNSLYQDSYSSESDALVIDESVPKKKKGKGKSNKKNKEVIRRMSEKENEIVGSPSESREKDSSVEEKIVELKKDLFSSDQSSNLTVQKPCDDLSVENQIIPSDDKQTSNIFNENSEIVDTVVSKTGSDCDHSVVDSETNCAQDLLTHSNPYFNESLFELSQLHHSNEETTTDNPSNILSSKEINSSCNKGSKRFKPKPKLKEYAQYLGLQPAVQFKCPKCGKSGFESLHVLQDHFLQCNAVQSLEKAIENENISGFKLTRKVFLCSACGTYYENWNLYMHMLEYHRRYICLYCLGMFSVLEDLCQHIQSRHNLEPGVKNTLEDFYNTYTEPCYVVCCECNRQFNEGDNFFYHNCIPQKSATKNKSKLIKQVIAPENHITGDSIMVSSETLNKVSEVTNHSEKKIEGNLENELINSDTKENEVHQVDSDKQNLIDNETSKQSVSDFSENADESSSSIKDKFPTTEVEDTNNKKDFSHSVNKDTCSDNSLEGEQDSLDSTKISEGIVDNHNSTENTMDGIEENFDNQDVKQSEEPEIETRKVPKLSLKLPKPKPLSDPEDSDESDKHEMEIDNIESENENDPEKSDSELLPADKDEAVAEKDTSTSEVQYPVADSDIPIVEIELDLSLDKMDIRILLQKCLQATAATCIYCNHARRIAVNGKQLGLHAIAEHRYSAINKSITAEELIPDSFNSRIKECFEQLQEVFFNLDSGASDEAVTFSHVFECFQCHYSTTVHKELYLHNRKFHSKNLLLCIMCKSNFYSYSELICHLCPGVYILDYNLQFRCCMCVSDDLPSSFRLMVHLRKRHNVCDVCLEMCHSQYKLSNHVWKHKLHHFCYRCGIAYRNKPDITRHLFWKHGTESVLCKKCLQKKWPHVYHFCVPPAAFTCEECNLVFSRAVSLKVHKRIHTEEKKHACTWEDCTEAFISKKLMEKHLKRHTEPPEEEKVEEEIKEEPNDVENETEQVKEEVDKDSEDSAKSVKPKVDVYDLPELNLSESDSSDSEPEPEKPEETTTVKDPIAESKIDNIIEDQNVLKEDSIQKSPTNVTESQVQEKFEDLQQQAVVDDASSSVMQNIWDNFKNYQASKEKLDHMLIGEFDTKPDEPYVPDIPIPMVEEELTWQVALRDHDYCAEQGKDTDTIIEVKPALESAERVDHDYCFQSESDKTEQPKGTEAVKDIPQIVEQKSPAQKRSSSSSSSSDSDSSCACGSSCSCSDSSSDSSSSSSDSSNSDSSAEGGTKKQQRRLKKKERKNAKKEAPKESEAKVDTVAVDQPVVAVETPINESDLETTESETDEEFYDREPQMFAKKILEEKRAQLLAEMGPNMVPNGSFIESTSRPPTPPAGTIEEEEQQPKKKKKTKKRKKKKSEKRVPLEQRTYSSTLIVDSNPPQISTPSYYQQFHQVERQSPTVAPITLSLSRNSPVPQTPPINTSIEMPVLARQDSTASDTSLRASKRRRVPNKFYGYSSDEENDKPKRSKMELNKTIPAPASPMLVPPITIKTGPSPMTLPPKPPVVEPLTLRLPRPTHPPNDFRVQRRPSIPPIRLFKPKIPIASRDESATDSNDSDMDEPAEAANGPPKPQQPQLYCYCRCPYDEVSEMIGCDSNDCEIEWFHFECVGIMVPPKGQWFCPDCRKKKQQQRRDILT